MAFEVDMSQLGAVPKQKRIESTGSQGNDRNEIIFSQDQPQHVVDAFMATDKKMPENYSEAIIKPSPVLPVQQAVPVQQTAKPVELSLDELQPAPKPAPVQQQKAEYAKTPDNRKLVTAIEEADPYGIRNIVTGGTGLGLIEAAAKTQVGDDMVKALVSGLGTETRRATGQMMQVAANAPAAVAESVGTSINKTDVPIQFGGAMGFYMPNQQIQPPSKRESAKVERGAIGDAVDAAGQEVVKRAEETSQLPQMQPSEAAQQRPFDNINSFLFNATKTGAQLAGQIVLAKGLAGFGKAAQSAAFVAPTVAQTGGQSYEDVKKILMQQGVSEEEAAKSAVGAFALTGTLSAVLEKAFPFERFIGNKATAPVRGELSKRFAAHLVNGATGGLSEFLTEPSQTALAAATNYLYGDKNAFNGIWEKMKDDAFMGLIVGNVAGVMTPGRTPDQQQSDQQKVKPPPLPEMGLQRTDGNQPQRTNKPIFVDTEIVEPEQISQRQQQSRTSQPQAMLEPPVKQIEVPQGQLPSPDLELINQAQAYEQNGRLLLEQSFGPERAQAFYQTMMAAKSGDRTAQGRMQMIRSAMAMDPQRLQAISSAEQAFSQRDQSVQAAQQQAIEAKSAEPVAALPAPKQPAEAVAPVESQPVVTDQPQEVESLPPPTLAEQLHSGSKLPVPKGATRVRVTDANGRTAVVPALQRGTLKGAGPYTSAEWGSVDRKGNFKPMEESGAISSKSKNIGKRSITSEQSKRISKAQKQLKSLINNKEIVGSQRSEMIENHNNLISFLQSKSGQNLRTDVFKGDEIARLDVDPISGERPPDGYDAIMYLEGSNSGKTGILPKKVPTEGTSQTGSAKPEQPSATPQVPTAKAEGASVPSVSTSEQVNNQEQKGGDTNEEGRRGRQEGLLTEQGAEPVSAPEPKKKRKKKNDALLSADPNTDEGKMTWRRAERRLQESIPGAKIRPVQGQEAAKVTLPNGYEFTVTFQDEIPLTERSKEQALKSGYTEDQLKNAVVRGYWLTKENLMALSGYAVDSTVDHEVFHMVEETGLLNKMEMRTLEKKYPSMEDRAKAYQRFVENNPLPGTPTSIFRKIQNFFKNLFDAIFNPDQRKAFKAVRSGEMLNRPANPRKKLDGRMMGDWRGEIETEVEAKFDISVPKDPLLKRIYNRIIENGIVMMTSRPKKILERAKLGPEVINLVNKIETDHKQTVGKAFQFLDHATDKLSFKDKLWIKKNFKDAYEKGGADAMQNERIKAFADAWTRIHNMLGSKAEQLGVMISDSRSEGGRRPFKRAIQNYFPRVWTEDAKRALEAGQGEVFDAIVDYCKRNEIDPIGIIQASNMQHTMRRNGHLESPRMGDVPTEVTTKSGKKVKLLEDDAFEIMTKYINNASRRLAVIQHMGQDTAQDMADDYSVKMKKDYPPAGRQWDQIWADIQGKFIDPEFSENWKSAGIPLAALEATARVNQLSASSLSNVGGFMPSAVKFGTIRAFKNTVRSTAEIFTRRLGFKTKTTDELEFVRSNGGWSKDTVGFLSETSDIKGVIGAISRVVFKATGFEGINRLINKATSMSAAEALHDAVNDLRTPKEGVIRGLWGMDSKGLRNMLKREFEFTDAEIDRMVKDGMVEKDYARAVQKAVGKTNLFNESVLDKPRWMSGPIARRVFAYMSYARAQGNQLSDAIGYAKEGNVRPLVTMLVGYAPVGIGVAALKSFLKNEEEKDKEFYEKLWQGYMEMATFGMFGGFAQDIYYKVKYNDKSIVTFPQWDWLWQTFTGMGKALLQDKSRNPDGTFKKPGTYDTKGQAFWKTLVKSNPLLKIYDAQSEGEYWQSKQEKSRPETSKRRRRRRNRSAAL